MAGDICFVAKIHMRRVVGVGLLSDYQVRTAKSQSSCGHALANIRSLWSVSDILMLNLLIINILSLKREARPRPLYLYYLYCFYFNYDYYTCMSETMVAVRPRRVSELSLEWMCNIVLGVLFFFYAYEYGRSLLVAPRLSVFVMLIFTTMAGTFFLIRRAPRSHSTNPLEWFYAAGGTWVTLLFRPAEGDTDIALFQVLLLCGMLISMTGLMSLGRSFGIVPANRGVQRSGLYRVVRHPMYAGYVLMHGCFVGQHLTYANIGVYILFIVFTVLRIIKEERHLSLDEAYCEMKKAVPNRLIPYVW